MSNTKTNKLYRTFLKGLFTEASPLTFPPDTSYDEDNCWVYVAGNRSRRLGMDYEDNYSLSSHFISYASAEDAPIVEFMWRNVAKIDGLNFLVHQIGSKILFLDASSTPTSPNVKSFTIELDDYKTISGEHPCQMSFGRGYLFITAENIDPLIVQYNKDSDTITVETINILIRDFDGIDDGLAVEEEPSSLSAAHHYNLKNQGWVGQEEAVSSTVQSFSFVGRPFLIGAFMAEPWLTPTSSSSGSPITTYKNTIGRYPGNNKQWWLGKTEVETDDFKVGEFNPKLLNTVHVGNTRAPRGHFIFNAFSKDRVAVSGIPNLPTEITLTRPVSTCFAGGHAFYAHQTDVYFSQILSEKGKEGLCFQDHDPTSEEISDLLPNDGGVIHISGADKIVHIREASDGVMVFAKNGVWFIGGGEGGFAADDYRISKISHIGTDAPYSIVEAEGMIYWWSKTGIQRISQQTGSFGAIPGAFQSDNITENTIDTFIKTISTVDRQQVKGVFDPATKTIHWIYSDASVTNKWFYNRILNFNTLTESFFPWSLTSGVYPSIVGVYISSDINSAVASNPVTDNGITVTSGGVTVTTSSATVSAKDNFLQFLVAVPSSGDIYKFTVGNFINEGFVDWETYDGTGVTYNSYVETGFELLDDAARDKQIIYIEPFFRQTEENFVASGDDYITDKPSSCFMTTKWDWSTGSASNKWSTKVQVYRHARVPPVNPLDLTFNTGKKLVKTRNKVRGAGQALQIRFECQEAGKNFDLLGWQAFYQGVTDV